MTDSAPTRAWMASVMEGIFDELRTLREAGQKEYAGGEDNAFGNFERLAADLDLTREDVLWVYAMKHRDGIAAWLRGHKSQREDVRGRINDLIVYLMLLRGMIEDDANQEYSSKHLCVCGHGVMEHANSTPMPCLECDCEDLEWAE